MLNKVRSIAFSLPKFLETLDSSEIKENESRLKTYFSQKCILLNQVFKMNEYDSKFMSLCFLEFSDYENFIPVISDELAFETLLKVKESDDEILPFLPEDEENDEIENETVANADQLSKTIKELQDKVNSLQILNNNLTDKNLNLESVNKELVKEMSNLESIKKELETEKSSLQSINKKLETEISSLKKQDQLKL